VTHRSTGVIVLVLLGVLVAGTGVASALPPGAATPVAPSGVIPGGSLTFTWQGVPDATFYYLQVNDATASPKLTLWYPAAQACAGGSATCSVTLTTGFAAGAGIWWVRTWNADGYGPWSGGMPFTVIYLPGSWGDAPPVSGRFQLVLGGAAVLDKLTGLVWERTPDSFNTHSWVAANDFCPVSRSTGGVVGWRLPTIGELASLVDRTRTDPSLPPGHPFGIAGRYWSATTSAANTTRALYVDFVTGNVLVADKVTGGKVVCVRGGQTPQSPQ
jgi:hypothetical protein